MNSNGIEFGFFFGYESNITIIESQIEGRNNVQCSKSFILFDQKQRLCELSFVQIVCPRSKILVPSNVTLVGGMIS